MPINFLLLQAINLHLHDEKRERWKKETKMLQSRRKLKNHQMAVLSKLRARRGCKIEIS